MNPLFRFWTVAAVVVLAATPTARGVDWSQHPENQWVRRSPRPDTPAPNFPYEGSGSYDPFQRLWIHHAGHDGVPQGFHTFTCDVETGRWEQRFPATSPPGVCCVDGGNVFDPAHRRFVRFPGGSLGHGFQWSRGVFLKESAVWLYDPDTNTWTNMRPPPYRHPEKYSREVIGGLNSGATFAASHEVVISLGGQGAGGGKNNLHVYDAYANALYHLQPANPPEYRDGMGLAYDVQHDKLVMFGSQYLSDERTWLYDFYTNRWEAYDLTPRPPARKGATYSTIPRLAYDSLNHVVLAVVWLDERRGHETWVFDTGQLRWTKMNAVSEPAPSKSRSRNLSFDAERNVFILETSSVANRPELWTYRYKAAPVTPLSAPANLSVVTDSDSATLTWTSSSTADAYAVYRADDAEPWKLKYQRIATTDDTAFTDSELTPGQVSFYRVTALGKDGAESAPSFSARTEPRVLLKPVVSVLAADRVEVSCSAHPTPDVIGYNVYRGLATVRTVRNGKPQAWQDNDPEYAEPQVVQVMDVTDVRKLNDQPLAETTFTDRVDLTDKRPEAGDYKFAVWAYILRAVNRLGVESGPSPYALTIPSEPANVLCRENGDIAELKWDPNPEKGIAGYHVYRLDGTWSIVRATDSPVRGTSFRHRAGREPTRWWIVAVDALGQEGQPSSPVWFNHSYDGFFRGPWHQ